MFADRRSFVIVAQRPGFRVLVDEPAPIDAYRHAPAEWLDARESRQGWCCPLLNTFLWLRRRDRAATPPPGSYFG
jgi:hypothetical protein